jgi:hypothetical protein
VNARAAAALPKINARGRRRNSWWRGGPRVARRVDDATACGREHSILGGAAYRPRARKPLWPCSAGPGDLFVCLISLRKMRCERAKKFLVNRVFVVPLV